MTPTKVVPTKPWYKSKMFWLGIAQILGGMAEVVTTGLQTDEGLGFIITGVLTVIFRYVTNQPITFSGREYKSVTTESKPKTL